MDHGCRADGWMDGAEDGKKRGQCCGLDVQVSIVEKSKVVHYRVMTATENEEQMYTVFVSP